MLAKIPYLLLAAYGLYAAIGNAVGLYKAGPSPWAVFEEVVAVFFACLGLLGVAGRVAGRYVWVLVAILVFVDVAWRLLT